MTQHELVLPRVIEEAHTNLLNVYAGNAFLVPGATAATLLMLGVLHARHMYDEKKVRND